MIATIPHTLKSFGTGNLPQMVAGRRDINVPDLALAAMALLCSPEAARAKPMVAALEALPFDGAGVPAVLATDGSIGEEGNNSTRLRSALYAAAALALLPQPSPQKAALLALCAAETQEGPVRGFVPALWDSFDFDDGTAYDGASRGGYLFHETAVAALALLFDARWNPESLGLAVRAAQFLVRYFRPLDSGLYASHVRDGYASFSEDALGYAVAGLLFSLLNTVPHPDELAANCERFATHSLALGNGYLGPTGTVCPRATGMVAVMWAAMSESGRARATLFEYGGVGKESRFVNSALGPDLVATLLFNVALSGRFGWAWSEVSA